MTLNLPKIRDQKDLCVVGIVSAVINNDDGEHSWSCEGDGPRAKIIFTDDFE